jgi:SNF2 family DNA or RNA helicase
MNGSLFNWQEPLATQGLSILQEREVLINALPTGTGKTYITAWELAQMKRPVLIICPKSVIRSWNLVLETFGVTPIAVINWEKLRGKTTKFWDDEKRQWTLPRGTVVVVDEVHQGCSGVDTLSGWMLAVLHQQGHTVLMQSATIADNPLKMRSVGFLCGLHPYRIGAFYNWCLDHGCYRNEYLNNRIMFDYGIRGQEAMARLHRELAPFMLRKKLEEIEGFPENQVSVELHTLDPKYQQQLIAIYGEIEGNENPLVSLLRDHQRAELCKVPILAELCMEELEEGNSVVVFLNFIKSLEELRSILPVPASVVWGKNKEDERTESIEAFQSNKVHVCLATIQAGGVGISLHDVRKERPRVSLINPSFSAVHVKQAMGRIHRAGGTKSVQRFILAAGTLEERVYRKVQAKIGNIGLLNDGDLSILEEK